MALKKPAIVVAAAALCLVGGAVTASAQESCTAYYGRVMGVYQTAGPLSPQYNQMAGDYSARCLTSAHAAPAPAAAQMPYADHQLSSAISGGALAGVAEPNDMRRN